MKDCKTIEAVEKNVFECMEWMENKIKDVIENLIKQNDETWGCSGVDNSYCDGFHDALIEVANELEIDIEY